MVDIGHVDHLGGAESFGQLYDPQIRGASRPEPGPDDDRFVRVDRLTRVMDDLGMGHRPEQGSDQLGIEPRGLNPDPVEISLGCRRHLSGDGLIIPADASADDYAGDLRLSFSKNLQPEDPSVNRKRAINCMRFLGHMINDGK
jgi:hypothetical protein